MNPPNNNSKLFQWHGHIFAEIATLLYEYSFRNFASICGAAFLGIRLWDSFSNSKTTWCQK